MIQFSQKWLNPHFPSMQSDFNKLRWDHWLISSPRRLPLTAPGGEWGADGGRWLGGEAPGTPGSGDIPLHAGFAKWRMTDSSHWLPGCHQQEESGGDTRYWLKWINKGGVLVLSWTDPRKHFYMRGSGNFQGSNSTDSPCLLCRWVRHFSF